MMARMEDRRAALGAAIRQRRLALRRTEREAAKLAQIARNTWSGAEKATVRTSEHVWPGIEHALDWEPGSVAAILSGGDPTPRARTRPQAAALSSGDELAEEVDRIRNLKISATARRRMIEALIAVYEEAAEEEDLGHIDRAT